MITTIVGLRAQSYIKFNVSILSPALLIPARVFCLPLLQWALSLERTYVSIMDGHSILTLGGSQPEAFIWAYDTSPEFPVVTWAHLAWQSVARYTGSTADC